jgi:FkbM family methyltransferase
MLACPVNRVLRRCARDLVKLVAACNNELAAILEQDMAHIQGKGSGVESVRDEVRQALKFLTPSDNKHLIGPLNINAELIVFDVGANIGNYTTEFLSQFSNAMIFAFEPSESSRNQLIENHKADMRVQVEAFGFSNEITEKILYSDYPGSSISSLTNRNLKHFGIVMKNEEKIKVDTVSNFCATNNVIPNLLNLAFFNDF